MPIIEASPKELMWQIIMNLSKTITWLFSWIRAFSYSLFGIIVMLFFINILLKQSTIDLLTFGGSILAIIAAISGLCYAGAACNSTEFGKKLFINSGHRMFHCFLVLMYSIMFMTAEIQIVKSKSVGGINNKIVVICCICFLILLSFINFIRAANSFNKAIFDLTLIFNSKFPYVKKDIDEIKPDKAIL
jgi:hypothetical protein